MNWAVKMVDTKVDSMDDKMAVMRASMKAVKMAGYLVVMKGVKKAEMTVVH